MPPTVLQQCNGQHIIIYCKRLNAQAFLEYFALKIESVTLDAQMKHGESYTGNCSVKDWPIYVENFYQSRDETQENSLFLYSHRVCKYLSKVSCTTGVSIGKNNFKSFNMSKYEYSTGMLAKWLKRLIINEDL